MGKRKQSHPFKANDALRQKAILQSLKERHGQLKSPVADPPASCTMQERLDQQATDWLNGQPRILNGLDDFKTLEKLALAKDEKGMTKFLRERARKAVQAQLTYWKKFFRLQHQKPGRPPGDGWIATAASMRTHGKSWNWIAQACLPQERELDPYNTKHRVRKAVRDYCRRTGIPLPPGGGRNSAH